MYSLCKTLELWFWKRCLTVQPFSKITVLTIAVFALLFIVVNLQSFMLFAASPALGFWREAVFLDLILYILMVSAFVFLCILELYQAVRYAVSSKRLSFDAQRIVLGAVSILSLFAALIALLYAYENGSIVAFLGAAVNLFSAFIVLSTVRTLDRGEEALLLSNDRLKRGELVTVTVVTSVLFAAGTYYLYQPWFLVFALCILGATFLNMFFKKKP